MPPDPALLDRTLASIRSNFESLRRFDPIPALMAESPPDRPTEFVTKKGSPVPPVSPWDHASVRWLGGSTISEGGARTGGRDLWVAGPRSATERLNLAAEAAAGFALLLRESVGLPKHSRARNPRDQWFWTVFEVAGTEPSYSLLRLKGGDVFRMAEGGTIRAFESQLEEIDKHGPPTDPFIAAIFCRDYSPVRYWELKDFVEASLWALDLVAVALPAVIERERGPDKAPAGDRPGEPVEGSKPRGPTTDQRLQALYMDPEKRDFVLEASEKDLAKEIGRSGPGAFTNCDFFQKTLRPLRAERRAENQEARRRRKATQKWGHFDSTAGPDVDADENH